MRLAENIRNFEAIIETWLPYGIINRRYGFCVCNAFEATEGI